MRSGGGYLSRHSFARGVLALALVGLVLPSACGSRSDGSGRVTVTFWHGMESGINNTILQAKIDDFNSRHSDIFVDAQIYGAADQLGPKLDAAVAGKTPPDLLWWAPAYFPKYAAAGALQTVDQFMAEDASFNRNDVYDYLWDLGTYDGHVYVTPFSASSLGMYYNKRLFADAGIATPPATWDDLASDAEKLTKGDVAGFLLPVGTSEWTVWTWECFLWEAGGELLTPDKTHAAFNGQAGVDALDFWRSLSDRKIARFSETDAGYKLDDMLAGRVAIMINGPWNYSTIKEQSSVEIGVFPLPAGRRRATNIGGESLFLFKSNPRRERAAWEFMKFVMSPDFQVDWAMNTGYLPVTKSASNDPRYQAFLGENPFIKAFNDQMPVGKTRPSIAQYPGMSQTLGKYIEAALYGKMSSKEALDRAAVDVDRLLALGSK